MESLRVLMPCEFEARNHQPALLQSFQSFLGCAPVSDKIQIWSGKNKSVLTIFGEVDLFKDQHQQIDWPHDVHCSLQIYLRRCPCMLRVHVPSVFVCIVWLMVFCVVFWASNHPFVSGECVELWIAIEGPTHAPHPPPLNQTGSFPFSLGMPTSWREKKQKRVACAFNTNLGRPKN